MHIVGEKLSIPLLLEVRTSCGQGQHAAVRVLGNLHNMEYARLESKCCDRWPTKHFCGFPATLADNSAKVTPLQLD